MNKCDLESLVRELMVDKSVPLSDDANMIEDLGFDSMSLFALVTEVESRFDVKIRQEDLVYESFETVGAIKSLLSRYA